MQKADKQKADMQKADMPKSRQSKSRSVKKPICQKADILALSTPLSKKPICLFCIHLQPFCSICQKADMQ
jgi:hypothetical protein